MAFGSGSLNKAWKGKPPFCFPRASSPAFVWRGGGWKYILFITKLQALFRSQEDVLFIMLGLATLKLSLSYSFVPIVHTVEINPLFL